jgi:dCMP deaminase
VSMIEAQRKIEKWDRRFLELAKHVSTWSKDPSTQVGAVLVNELKQVVGMGYNGFARGVEDTDERLNEREVKYRLVVHAEVNAIIQAGHEARGSTLYVYPSFMLPPICHDCAKAAIQAGVVGIVGYEPDESDPRVQRWKDSIAYSKEMWDEAGLFIASYNEI